MNIGVIGVGDIANKNYLPGLNDPARDIYLKAACDIVPERADAMAHKFNAEHVYYDHKKMIERDDIDLVIVLTPVATHPPFLLDALYAGKHVYTEKPFGMTRHESDVILELAEAQGRLAMSAPMLMLYPEFDWLKTTVRAGAAGRVLFARAHSSHGGANRGPWATDSGNFFREDTAGKMPPLYDMGVYGLTIMTHCLGSIRRVSAMAGIGVAERAISKVMIPDFKPYVLKATMPDNTGLLLDFGDACFAVQDGSFCIPYWKGPQYEFYGYEGAIHFSYQGMEIVSERPEFASPDPANPVSWHSLPLPEEKRLPEKPNWGQMLARHVKHCLATGERPVVSGYHARHITEVMEKAALAATTGRTQEIESGIPG